MELGVGDLVVISPRFPEKSDRTEFAVITHIKNVTYTCVWVVEELRDATECDIIASVEILGEEDEVAVLTLAEATITKDQVRTRAASLGPDVVDEVLSCRYGNPSPGFEHGEFLLPLYVDRRHSRLTELIRSFRQEFSLGHLEVLYEGTRDEKMKELLTLIRGEFHKISELSEFVEMGELLLALQRALDDRRDVIIKSEMEKMRQVTVVAAGPVRCSRELPKAQRELDDVYS